MDTYSFVLSFDADKQELSNFLQQNKDAFDRSKSYTFSYYNSNPNGIPNGISQKAKQKAYKKPPNAKITRTLH